ncbi:hypothetical protein [Phenylobacterium sp.]|jgi:hypothetical protein|uniref:hypothetical protein n=1 Tax=Phenylobacterium sp. TaxID=1871053 RepID=UPI002F95A7CC
MAEEAVETELGAGAEAPEIWSAPPPLGPTRLIAAGFRNVRAHISSLAILALILAAATAAIRLSTRELGAPVSASSFDALKPAYFAYEGLVALATSVVTGLMIRAMLQEGRGRFALDRGLVIYVVLAMVASVISIALTGFVAASDPSEMAQAFGVFAFFAVLIALIYVFTKLLLWPMGYLLGDGTITARRSWALMKHTTWAYIGALILGFLPLLPLYFIVMLPSGFDSDGAALPLVLLEHAITAAWVTLCAGIAAAVWRARVLGEPLSPA